jgi:SMC interacting uncharacterized protein involved in chromosome segregation
MKKGLLLFVVTGWILALAGCEPGASDDELARMCANLTTVRGEVKVPTVSDLTTEVNEEYARKEKKLLDWKARDMKSWDEELDARLKILADNPEEMDEAGEPMTPEKLKTMYAKKKKIGAKQFDDDLLKLTVEKKTKLAGVEDVVKQAQAEFDSLTEKCIEGAKKEKVSKSLAQCRIDAPDKDTYWNKCK